MRTTNRSTATAALLLLLSAATGSAPDARQGAVRIIEIRAERFDFWPSEIALQEGEEVEFRIRSEDTMHGFRIAGTTVNVMVPKRGQGSAAVRFTAGEPGRYTFECSRLCGAGHNFMRGELIVRPARSHRP